MYFLLLDKFAAGTPAHWNFLSYNYDCCYNLSSHRWMAEIYLGEGGYVQHPDGD